MPTDCAMLPDGWGAALAGLATIAPSARMPTDCGVLPDGWVTALAGLATIAPPPRMPTDCGDCQTAVVLPWPDWRLLHHLLGCRQTAGFARRLGCCPGRIGDYCTTSKDAERLRGLPDGWCAALAGLATTALLPPRMPTDCGCCQTDVVLPWPDWRPLQYHLECKLKSYAFMKEEFLAWSSTNSILL